ncbi:MAG: hypothetical protein ACT6Q9_14840 [Polaromonas sp.]|uniref:hypothetical protein n=1 Tax=Polaromonas sp. TaxID=1869339 RepID=UPI004035D3AB
MLHKPTLNIGRWAVSACLFTSLGAGLVHAQAPAPAADTGAAALQAKHTALAPQLARNPFQRPLVLESIESAQSVSGSAYAVLNHPYNTVLAAFKDPETWCEVLILHLNTKHCSADKASLSVSVGKKTPQELKDAHALTFSFAPAATRSDYLAVRLNAPKGPLGTHNYRIDLEAVPVDGDKTFMHLRYSYGYGISSRLAMQAYMATVASSKIGFTEVGGETGGARAPVGGMRGAVERNTMRYYLAIDAYLASLSVPASQQFEKRLQHWFDATERYPRQLHEIDRTAYLSMKRSEYKRQQGSP